MLLRATMPAERVSGPRNSRSPQDVVRRLATLLAAYDRHEGERSAERSFVATGWDSIDRILTRTSPHDLASNALGHVGRGGLLRRMIHEWLCSESRPTERRWSAPHTLFMHLARRALEVQAGDQRPGLVLWIGRRIWPQAMSMRCSTTEEVRRVPSTIRDRLLMHSLFVDPPDDASRLWAIDLALRSPAAEVVIADGSKLRMAESRRLQLAAEGGRALALLARPAWEAPELSAAATRWLVSRMPSPSQAPRWMIELLRCRHGSALQTGDNSHGRDINRSTSRGGWEMEYASSGCLRLVADVVDRPGATSRFHTFAQA